MNRISKLPVRSSQLLEPGSSKLPVRSSQLLEPDSTRKSNRLSRTDNKRTRASSTSRVSNTLSTPSLRRSKSSVSLKRTPQSVQAIRCRSTERNRIKKKDDRPIQDKTWQAEMLQKTQNYFKNDPEGSQILNQARSLRPITIKMFIELVNIVLKNVDERFEKLTTTNYVELLPKHLLKLMYPGSVTSSMMKTASTMHTWPHILGILSWLVDLNNTMQACHTFIKEKMFIMPIDIPDNELQDLKIRQLQTKVLMTAFVKWNRGQDEEFVNYIKGLKEIYNFNDSTANYLKQSIEQDTRQLQTDEEVIQNQKETIKKKEAEYEKLSENKNYIEDVILQQKDYIKTMEEKIADCIKDNKMLHDAYETHRIENEKLVEKIKLQPMSKEEKENHLRNMGHLNAKKDLIIKERKLQQRISDDTDIRISQLKLQIDEEVSAYNIKLIQPCLKYPELKECTIKSCSILGTEFYTEIENKSKMLEELLAVEEEKLKHERHALVTIGKQVQQKQKELEEVSKKNKKVQLEIEEMSGKIESVIASNEEENEYQSKITESIKTKTKDLQLEIPNICKIKEAMKQKAEEYFTIKKQSVYAVQQMLKIAEKLERDVDNIAPDYQNTRRQITEAVIERRRKFNNLLTISSDENEDAISLK